MLQMMFKLGMCAEKSWRKLRGFNYLAKVITGIQFPDATISHAKSGVNTFKNPYNNQRIEKVRFMNIDNAKNLGMHWAAIRDGKVILVIPMQVPNDVDFEAFRERAIAALELLGEVKAKGFIAESTRPSMFWFNPNLVFNGDRMTFIHEYRRKPAMPDRDPNTVDWLDEGNPIV